MRIFLLFLTVVFLNAINLDNVIKTIPKNSPDYALDMALAQKIKELKFIKPHIAQNIKTEKQFINNFYKLVEFQKEFNDLPHQINEIQTKVSILKNNQNITSKLQYIYYKKLLEIYTKKFRYFNDNFSNLEKILFKQIKNISFNIDNNYQWDNLLIEKQKELEKLNINLQKWQLLDNTQNINKTKQFIQKNINLQQNIYKHLLNKELIKWFQALKLQNKKAFDIDDNILIYAKKIEMYKEMSQLISDFEKYIFGTKVLVYGAKNELKFTIEKLIGFINYPLFSVGNRIITPLNFAIFVFVLFLGWFIGKYYKNLIYRLRHNKNISYSTATLLANMGYYTILTFSFLFALKVVGLDLSSLAIIAGALSVGIGFGLQNVVSNFVSGVILMFERSIKVGDYIQIDTDTRGEVIDISMRSTIIRTNDNINLIIPNQSFIQNNVINWTLGDDIVRFRVPFGVAYGSDIDEVEKVILEALRHSDIPYIKKHSNLNVTPYVVFMQMADSSLNFELFIWVKGEYARRPRRTRSAFLKMIYKALNKAGITIPFPQQDLYIKEIEPIEVKIKKE